MTVVAVVVLAGLAANYRGTPTDTERPPTA